MLIVDLGRGLNSQSGDLHRMRLTKSFKHGIHFGQFLLYDRGFIHLILKLLFDEAKTYMQDLKVG